MPREKPLDPLIPLDSLKKVVQGLAQVPKDAVTRPRPEPKQPKNPAR